MGDPETLIGDARETRPLITLQLFKERPSRCLDKLLYVPEQHPVSQITHSADGTSLGYQTTGEGPFDLIFLGGGPFALEVMWDDPGFLRFAKRLGKFCRVVWADPRSWGASEGEGIDSYDLDVSDTDISAILSAVAAESAVLAGWSTTGSRAIHFAARYPEKVLALVLIDSCAHYVREPDYPWGYPRESLDNVVTSLRDAWVSGADVDVTAPGRDERFRAWYARARRAGGGPTNLAEGFRRSLENDVRDLLPKVSARTLVLHQKGDRFIHLGAGRYLAEHIPDAKFVALPGDSHQFFVGDTDALVDEIEEFLTGSRSGAEGDLFTTTILFTDIVGSTEHQTRVGQREWSRLLADHDAMARELVTRYRGHIVKTTGDGFLITFDATTRGLRCGADLLTRSRNIGLDLRAGLHIGDIQVMPDDVAGLAVNIAKRVCDLAAPGELLVGGAVRDLMVGSGFGFLERGERELKGVPGSWRLFRVV